MYFEWMKGTCLPTEGGNFSLAVCYLHKCPDGKLGVATDQRVVCDFCQIWYMHFLQCHQAVE